MTAEERFTYEILEALKSAHLERESERRNFVPAEAFRLRRAYEAALEERFTREAEENFAAAHPKPTFEAIARARLLGEAKRSAQQQPDPEAWMKAQEERIENELEQLCQ